MGRRYRGIRRRAAGALLLACFAAGCLRESPPVVLATTTSVVNSGLTEALLPIYQQQTGVRVNVIPAGSGLALKLLADGQADVAITHAPAQESEALAAHPQWRYRKILFNDFLVVGPRDDPAGVAQSASAADAMSRIASSKSRFISRGDRSGTEEREHQLWQAAGVKPVQGQVVIAGAGMGDTLRIASEMTAYTLTDRATFERLAPRLALQILSSGDPVLLNTYAVIADPADKPGMRFAQWLSEDAGRQAMTGVFASGQVRGFSLWPAGKPGLGPADRP